ncbi:hypothetical protein llap_6298 [Limosa lapponica baueri]|uniref:Uncharacterized protein n=1 Tax=Limosa lapponica baueri TaxID=1758121 RepID=A0A2I0UBH6_LIMLA|nr:hypothetical protein llap_6298 [Limosa lapponica baueri]
MIYSILLEGHVRIHIWKGKDENKTVGANSSRISLPCKGDVHDEHQLDQNECLLAVFNFIARLPKKILMLKRRFNYVFPTNRDIGKEKEARQLTNYFLTINTCYHQRPVAEFKKKKKKEKKRKEKKRKEKKRKEKKRKEKKRKKRKEKRKKKKKKKFSFKETWSQAHILFLPLGAEVRALDKAHFSSLYRAVD